MRTLAILFLLVAGTASAAPVEKPEHAGLRISTGVLMVAQRTINTGESGPFKVFYSFEVITALENVGSTPIRIPTTLPNETIARRFSGSGPKLLSAFYFFEERSDQGQRIVVSECQFNPVTLAPGEVTMLVPVRDEAENLFFNRNPSRRALVEVVYRVDPELAKRYGWWTGEISAVAKEEFGIKDAPISAPEDAKDKAPQ